jgi:hypothetical protein
MTTDNMMTQEDAAEEIPNVVEFIEDFMRDVAESGEQVQQYIFKFNNVSVVLAVSLVRVDREKGVTH